MITQDFKEKIAMQKAQNLFDTNRLNYIIISDNLISYNIREDTDDSKEIEMGYKLLEAKELQWFDKLNNWNRNEFSTVCIPFSFFVTIY